MLLYKLILSPLFLFLLVSVNKVHGDGTTDDSCPQELAAYEACAMSNQAVCSESGCDAKEPELTEEVFVSLMTDPSFLCEWFNEALCAVEQCCNVCQNEAKAYLDCLAMDFSEDRTCEFACTDNGGAVDDGSDSGGTADDGNDNNVSAGDGSDNGNNENDGSDNNGAGAGENSSAGPSLLKMTLWTSIYVIMVVGYELI